MAQLRASENYVWSTLDVLGEGATGAVYKARHKKNGDLYAVKTFNRMSHMRPPDVQMREFDVLQKLNHENIVKLLAVEEETSVPSKVIVMELCTGGSLFNILDDPINAYGVEETDFFRVLHDVAAGMKHLRDQDIVHRDIKPGNIMKFIHDDGRVVFKLTDFGAARELQEEEQFMSLYGTEEYLHPDLYERAVLRRPVGKTFGVTVDLWSLGVTLYHVAAGRLPFRPFGGRKNRETMYKITTEKESGVISGVQHTENGHIEWSRELPKQCQLSIGARHLITPLLAGLLESDPCKIWSFDKFFDQVARITNKRGVHIFSSCTAEQLSVYVDRKEGFAKLQELIAVQTDLRANQQFLLFENCLLTNHISQMQKAETYPETAQDNPIFLYKEEDSDYPRIPQIETPILPQFTSTVALDNDVAVAKRSAGIIYLMVRYTGELLDRRFLFRESVDMYCRVLVRDVEHLRSYVSQFYSLCEETDKRLQQFIESHKLQIETIKIIGKGFSNTPDITSMEADLQNLISNQNITFRTILEEVDTVKKYIEEYYERIVTSKQLMKRWFSLLTQGGSQQELSQRDIRKWKTSLKTKANNVKEVWENFRRDKSMKRLSYNDEQIHKFDRGKLTDSCIKVRSLMEHAFTTAVTDYSRFQLWFNEASKQKIYLNQIEGRVDSLAEKQAQLSNQLSQCSKGYAEKVRNVLLQLESSTTTRKENVNNMTSGQLTTDGAELISEDIPPPLPPRRPLSQYSRSLIKELNRSLSSLKEESTTLKSDLQINSDLLKQLEEISYENGK